MRIKGQTSSEGCFFRPFRRLGAWSLIVVFGLCCLGLCGGCGERPLSPEEEALRVERPHEQQTVPSVLHIPLPSLPATDDPLRLQLPWTRAVWGQIFEGLTDYSAHQEVRLLELSRAESEDQQHWHLVLRKDLKWSDGQALCAEDYKRSWLTRLKETSENQDLFTLPSTAPQEPYARYEAMSSGLRSNLAKLFWIRGARAYHEGKISDQEVGLHVEGDSLWVDLVQPLPEFLEWLSDPCFYPQPRPEQIRDDLPRVGNSAYVLSEAKAEQWVLKKNPFYWDAVNVHIPRIEFQVVPDGVQAYEDYRNGVYDLIGDPFYPVVRDRREAMVQESEKTEYDVGVIGFVRLNLQQIFYQSAARREALYELMDPVFPTSGLLQDHSPAFPKREALNLASREKASQVLPEGFRDYDLMQIQQKGFVGLGGPDSINHRILALVSKEWLTAMGARLTLRQGPRPGEVYDFIYDWVWIPTQKPEAWAQLLFLEGLGKSPEDLAAEKLPVDLGYLPLHLRNATVLNRGNLQGVHVGRNGLLPVRDLYFR